MKLIQTKSLMEIGLLLDMPSYYGEYEKLKEKLLKSKIKLRAFILGNKTFSIHLVDNNYPGLKMVTERVNFDYYFNQDDEEAIFTPNNIVRDAMHEFGEIKREKFSFDQDSDLPLDHLLKETVPLCSPFLADSLKTILRHSSALLKVASTKLVDGQLIMNEQDLRGESLKFQYQTLDEIDSTSLRKTCEVVEEISCPLLDKLRTRGIHGKIEIVMGFYLMINMDLRSRFNGKEYSLSCILRTGELDLPKEANTFFESVQVRSITDNEELFMTQARFKVDEKTGLFAQEVVKNNDSDISDKLLEVRGHYDSAFLIWTLILGQIEQFGHFKCPPSIRTTHEYEINI